MSLRAKATVPTVRGGPKPLFWVVVSLVIGTVAAIIGGTVMRWAALAFVAGNAFLGTVLLFFTLLGGIPLFIVSIEVERIPVGIIAVTFLAMAVVQKFVMNNVGRREAGAEAHATGTGCLIGFFFIVAIIASAISRSPVLTGIFVAILLIVAAIILLVLRNPAHRYFNTEAEARRTGYVISVLSIAAVSAYAGLILSGWIEARGDAAKHRARAAELHAAGRDGAALGEERLQILLRVTDPNFMRHNGMDSLTPCARSETITQDLAGALDDGPAGIGRLEQHCHAGYALGLETRLSKEDIIALYLDHVYMGRASDGRGIRGFFKASEIHFGKEPKALSRQEYLTLVAILMRSGFSRWKYEKESNEQILRIERLLAGKCKARYNGERYLYLCASRRFDEQAKNG